MTKLSVGLEQAEEMTGISHHTFRKLVRKGKIKAARVGRRIVIPIAELERLVKPADISGSKRNEKGRPQ
jgi:excisionase family DNA binding protein